MFSNAEYSTMAFVKSCKTNLTLRVLETNTPGKLGKFRGLIAMI